MPRKRITPPPPVPPGSAPTPVNALDPLGIGATMSGVWAKMLEDPSAALAAQAQLISSTFELGQQTLMRLAGLPAHAVAAPEAADRRFAGEAWSQNAAFDFLKQAYLLAAGSLLASVDQTPGIDPKMRKRARFFTKQFVAAMSPSNFAFFNPDVIAETITSGGQNLLRGMANLAEDARENHGQVQLVDKQAFQVGGNVATTPGKVVYRNELVELIQYTPTTPQAFARPLVIVPPWINKFYILDLRPDNSFIKYAVDSGLTTFVLSWRNPGAELAQTSMADYVSAGPIAASRAAAAICGSADVNLIGYCIGGTLTAMTLAYLKRIGDPLVHSATFFAALVDFEDPGEIDAFLSEEGLRFIEHKMGERGYLDASEMASSFNMLRSNDLIWSVAVNRYLLGKAAPAFDLLFWNGDATRMPCAMHSYYLREMYLRNNLVKPDALEVKGTPIDLRRVDVDVYCVATAEDHIAPWRSVYKLTQLVAGNVRFRLGHSGHIAGIISPPGKKKGQYWSSDATPAGAQDWLEGAQRIDGSWWPDWSAWIGARSGDRVAARTPGEDPHYPALAEAPGSYVFEK